MNEKNNAVAQHTPGPWWVFANDAGVGVTTGVADVAHCHGFDSRRSAVEVEANARLIAAAPELLETVERLTKLFGDSKVHGHPETWRELRPELFQRLDSLIAKARGAQ